MKLKPTPNTSTRPSPRRVGVWSKAAAWREYPITPGCLEGASKRGKVLSADYVLEHRNTKLTPLLKLKYHDSIADAVADLDKPDEIGKVFSGFQRHLYENEIRM